ncbi:hypothetical protein EMCG_05946 [[Emmonsia] crescens]|uniref:Uncharacterized protein n=1 Tax=[Emmonsia] crescens TaxID=73230 RepID=A0A0G2IDS8_9EURO|nr:hypothetical protein EMCG_05946 [Emmonsia crescens UAMH 3008]
MIQNIEKTVLLSKYINLLAAEIESKTADQKMRNFEKAEKENFEMIIISDEKNDDEKKKNEK